MSENEQKDYDPSTAPFSWEKLDGLLAYKTSLVSCGDLLGCHENTVKNHIRKRYDMTFGEYSEKKLSATRVKLVQKALQMAYSGNATMLIFSLKNLCKWSDKSEAEITNEKDALSLAYKLKKDADT